MRKLKLFSLFLLLLIGVGQMWAETVTYTVSSTTAVTKSSGTAPTGATTEFTTDGSKLNNSNDNRNGSIQLLSGKYASLTLKGWKGHKITGLVLNMASNAGTSTNNRTNGTFSLVAGSTTLAAISSNTTFNNWYDRTAYSTSLVDVTVSLTNDDYEIQKDEDVVITITCGTKNSLYVMYYTITYEAVESGTGKPTVLESIAVGEDLENKTYETTDKLDLTGLTVTGTYSDESSNAISSGISWQVRTSEAANDAVALDAYVLTAGQTSVDVQATVDEISSAWVTISGLTVTEHVVTAGTYDIVPNNSLYGTSFNGSVTGDAANVPYSGTKYDVTVTYAKASGSNMYINNSQTRLYPKNTLVISAPTGYNISAVTFTGTFNNKLSANVGTLSEDTKSWTGKANSITFTGGGTSNNIIITNITVTYAAIVPEVTVDPDELSFDAKQNIAVNGKNFTLTGANLSSGLTLAASAGYSVAPTSISASDAMAQGGVEVTVTPATPTATTTPVEGTVTISGGGLANDVEVALSMAVTPTYAVAMAVNDNTMGSATMDGGTITVYKANNETVALVATPASGHEFMNWTATSGISFDNANNAEATATITAAGTITANFKEQACTGLAAPILNGITKTYNSATIAWNAVANASEGYEVYVYNDAQKTSTKASDLVTEGTSFAVDDLAANTTYYYTVMAVGDGTSYCDENNELLEGSFTTNDYPAATLTLSENGEEHAYAGSHKLNDVVKLPSELEGAGCKNKVLVGWSSVAVEETDIKPASNYWDAGAEYTIVSTEDKLYTVFADEEGGAVSYVKLTSNEFDANAQYVVGALKNSETHYFYTYSATNTNTWGKMTGDLENNNPLVFTLSGTADALKIKNSSNHYIKAVSSNFQMSTSQFSLKLNNDGTIHADLSGTDVNLRYNSDGDYGLRFYTKTTGSSAYLYKIEQEVSYSGYTTSCEAQLPVLAAPTFSEAGDTYYEGKSITLSATNDAEIYYTLDGSEPTTSSTKYSSAISLNERTITTIKAISVKDGYETSEVAEAEYNINLPYDFAAFAALTKVDNKEYAVRGIISEKGSLTNNNQLPYYISANGQTAGQIKCHNGLKLNKETFTSADDVNVGDNVTVVGTWSTSYNNLNAGNWMLEYAARGEATYTIEGDLTTTTFNVNETFDDAILGNLSVKATYANGYYETVSGAEFSCGDKAKWAANETSLTVIAKQGDDELVQKDFTVVVSSATLVSIALKADNENYQTKKVYYIGEAFVLPTIVATLSEGEPYEATATGVTGYNNAEAGVQEVTVSYARAGGEPKTVSYNVTVKAIFGNETEPHTVAVAAELIAPYTTESSDKMYVRGIVSKIVTAYDSQYGNVSYNISDDGETTSTQVQVFRGKGFGGANLSSANDIKVGDAVVVKGTALNYTNKNTLELSGTPELVSQLREPAFAIADITAYDEFEANFSEDLAVEPTANDGDAEFALSVDDESVVKIVDNKLRAVAEGDAVVKATREATSNSNALNYSEKEITFNVHVIAARTRYTVTFDANGADGGSAPEAIANQLEGATVDLPVCSYSWAGHKFTGWTVTAAGEPVEVENNQFTMPTADVTVTAQWAEVATAKISFMVGGKEKASIDKEQDVAFTIAQDGSDWAPTGFTFVGWSTTEYVDEVAETPETITEYTPQVGIATVSLYGIYSRLDISGANYGKYEKVTEEPESLAGDYLIVCEDQNVAMDGSLSTLDNAGNNKAVTISDGVLTLENADNYVFTIAAITGGYSIKSKSGYYVGGKGSDSNGMNSSTSTEYTNTISISNGDAEIIGNGAYMRCNPNSDNWFRYFKATTYTGQKAIQLYKKNLGTTYYTSSPVEKVTITFNANGGEGGCQNAIINKGSQLTICAEAPAKSHSEFAGWKNGDDVYVAGQAYTFDADITLTAQWDAAATYTVTFDKNGGTGTAETLEDQYAGDAITLPAALTKDDYNFQGWKYDDKLYEAGASFTMPAADVAFVAQWRKASIPVDMMSKVTDASALADGMQVALGYGSGENFAMAGDITGNNKFMTSVTDGVSMSNDVATYTNDVIVMTLEQAESGWKITKDGTNYLTLNGENVKWDTQANATVWTITFENGNTKIATSTYWIQYNSGSPRFKTYGASSNMKDIQLYGKAVVVSENAILSDLGYVEGDVIVVNSGVELAMNAPSAPTSITVKDGATVTVSAQTTANNITVEEGGTVEISAATTAATVTVKKGAKMEIKGNGSVTTNEPLILYTTLGKGTGTTASGNAPGSSSEIINAERLNANSDVFIEIELTQEDKASTGWYAFSVPFPIDAMNGVYYGDTKLTNEVGYAIMSYHGDVRAQGLYGWKKYRGIMQPGVLYVITVGNTDYKTLRFKKVAGANLAVTNSDVAVNAYPSTNPANAAWNGIGNPNLAISNLSTTVTTMQFYDHKNNSFVGRNHSVNLVVGSAFFIQYNASTAVSIPVGTNSGNGYLAPRREQKAVEEMIYEVQLTNVATGELEDNVFLTAREDAKNEYEIGRDVAKMSMGAAKCAQMYVPAYGTNLCAADFQLVNDKAEYPLTITAPADGTYRIEAAEAYEGATLYLTKDGRVMWNLSMSACEVELSKGTTENYGLLLVRKAPGVATGMENVQSDNVQCTKVIIDNQVFILRGGQMYDLTGKAVK